MLLHVLMTLLLVSTMSAMPTEQVNEDTIEQTPRNSPPSPPSEEVQKEEAVLLGALLREIGKEAQKHKSRDVDANLSEEEDENLEDLEERSPDEDEELEDEMEERNIEDAEEDEEMEREAEEEEEEDQTSELEERRVKGRWRRKYLKKLLKKFVRGKIYKNSSGKKVVEFLGKGGYQRAQKHFFRLGPKGLSGRKGSFTGYLGKAGKVLISVKEKSKYRRPTLTIERKNKVLKLRY